MIYRLIYLTGARAGQRVTVATEPMTLGREEACDVALDDPESAARHAEIVHRGDGLFVRDLGSMNRLLVNQREVTESRLKHGDILEVGRTRFLVQCCVQADVAQSAPARRRRRQALRLASLAAALAAGFFVYRAVTPRAPPVEPAAAAALAPVEVPLAVPAPAPAPAPDEAVSEEINQLREQMADLSSTVKNLAAKPAAPPSTPLAGFRTGESLKERTGKMLELARADAEAGRLAEADRQLVNIQIVDPDFIEAYVQRAALLEKRGMIGKAMEQWTEVVARSVGSPLYDRAVQERIRLAALNHEPPDAAPVFRIIRAEVQRFPQSEEYAEMRMLSVLVQPVLPEAVDAAAVRMEVTFYVRPAGGDEPLAFTTEVARVEGEWPPGRERTLTASYVVPKGVAPAGEFCGFVAGVFYRDRLQASDARPRSLLVARSPGQSDIL